MESKTIKGQAWIQGDSLVQQQILLLSNGSVCENVVSLIDNIWDNLLGNDDSYPIKTNGKGYFYWEYTMNDTVDDSIETTINFECPRPKEGLFEEPYDLTTGKTDWAKYWLTKLKTTVENSKAYNIQKTEYTLPGTQRMNFTTGLPEELDEVNIKINDIGDITNLLSMF